MNATAIICCDADGVAGYGHLVRCLGIAEALAERSWTVTFFGRYGDRAKAFLGTFQERCAAAERGSAAAAREAAAAAHSLSAGLVVIDSYEVDAAFVGGLAAPGRKVLLVDDFSSWRDYPATHLLNFAIDAGPAAYPLSGTDQLLGPSYFPVRRAFRAVRAARVGAGARTSKYRRICLSVSSDPGAERAQVILAALKEVDPNFDVRVVLSHPPGCTAKDLEASVGVFGTESKIVYGLVDLSDSLNWADIVVCSGGLVKYEAGYLGVPAMVISRPGKEARDTEAWVARNAAINLGNVATLDKLALCAAFEAALSRSDLAAMGRNAQDHFPEDCGVRAVEAVMQHQRQGR